MIRVILLDNDVKVKDINKNTNNMDNVDECRDLEISIEEEDINSFLRPIL